MEAEPLLPPAPPLRPVQPAWRRLLQQHWPQYIAVAAVWLLMKWVDPIEPRPRAIYHGSDAEYWQAGWASLEAAHHACLNLVACVFTTGLIANTLKSQVARPRPDFIARCFPSTLTPVWGDDGMPQCEDSVPHQTIKTGLRSFPSVHAAWSGAGLGFLCLWLLGTLRCFAGGTARPAHLVASLLPLAAAGWIGVTRVQNNRHHPSDVLGAYALGLILALLFYLQVFASPFSANAGSLAERGCTAGKRTQAAAAVEFDLAGEPGTEPIAI
ncbi:lipid phosphate phosphatase 2-like isoform X3 [Chlorella sorokiniana]|uniref:Lipid phosphate phosphatase 2-like isoform X3 n=1 Tax=Chlorella sorokiniana TaxID=3076 RepID=A0A2P6TFK5_CHLSO|nr:lipid phosphate phosphatase 2-like isoform X3 [Chlorella sorokiniana]|eukprot:PRW32893.1 lipid phosphate phosphatase 2-like isoform X3 [Chlorella sorokiniana]